MIDVVIAGGGPNGLMLARELVNAGVRPVLLERRTEPDLAPKANGLVGRVIQALDYRGLLDTFAARAAFHGPAPQFQFGAIPLPLFRLGEDNPMWTMPMPQRLMEQLLTEEAGRLGIEIRYGHQLTGLRQDADGVDLTVCGPDGEYPLRAAYLVGCDGGRSTVRKLAGIGFPGHTNDNAIARTAWVELGESVRVPGSTDIEVPGIGRIASYSFNRFERGVFAYSRFPDGTNLVMAMEQQGAADAHGEPTLDDLRAACERVLGTPLPIIGLADDRPIRQITGQNTRQADRYSDRRVLLAGDAAHVHFGIGGPGLNLGMQDVINLGWKLAATVRGTAPDGLLDTYEAERHPVGRRVMMSTMAQFGLLADGPEVTAVRELLGELLHDDATLLRIANLMSGADTHYAMPGSAPHPLLGMWMPDLKLTTVDGVTRVAELVRAPGGILLDFTGATELPAAWAGRVRHVRADQPEPPADALLLRPDGYVAWAGGDGLDTALRTWFGSPE